MASRSRDVVLHVYDFAEVGDRASGWLSSMNFGIHHTGVEVAGFEYSFNDAGIYRTPPGACASGSGAVCKRKSETVLGTHVGTVNDLNGQINALRGAFAPGSYSLVGKNCNHFADALCRSLVGVGIPAGIHRAAAVGAFFSVGTKGMQVQGEPLERGKPADSPAGASGASSWFGSSRTDAPAPAGRTKKKELTATQKAMLAKLKAKD
ncbi:PPPDE putative peptidase domain-containing protein [Pelagophyceae sp. CCMP2097]|nr:PPPDE putative peptidase domain-containing protein [Pelagophyceae sp. CCMP2097]